MGGSADRPAVQDVEYTRTSGGGRPFGVHSSLSDPLPGGIQASAPEADPREARRDASDDASDVQESMDPMPDSVRTLSIVIPALNEEAAIAATIERCLDARAKIVASTEVDAVEVIVVSDGSSDRTEAIANGFEEVSVLAFDANRGYGAAIKAGWQYGRGELLAFLDGDGTCEPAFFADLCRAIDDRGADIALASRMGPDSAMPRIRSFGNRIFALLVGALSKRSVADTASGMRVVRRDCLDELYPLPDGLHFTPAMSARVLIGDTLELVELPMAYAERTGKSKLSVLRDGFRFLLVILRAAVTFRPARLLLVIAGLLGLGAVGVGAGPWLHWLVDGRLDESEIYRILLSSLLVTSTLIFVCGAVVAEWIAAKAHGRPPAQTGVTGQLARLFTPRMRQFGGAALLLAATAIVWPGIIEFVSTGEVEMHWSRAMLASLLVVSAMMLAVTTFLLNMMTLIEAEGVETTLERPPDRVRPATNGREPPVPTSSVANP
jgi:hypothetical protein